MTLVALVAQAYSHSPGPNCCSSTHFAFKSKKNPCLVKSDYRPRLHSIVVLSNQQLNTSHKQWIWHDIFGQWPVKNKIAIFVLSKFVAQAALWNWHLATLLFSKHVMQQVTRSAQQINAMDSSAFVSNNQRVGSSPGLGTCVQSKTLHHTL